MKTIVLVGCGRIAKRHVQVLSRLDGVRLAAVCDIVPERARAAAEPLGIPWYQDPLEMVRRERPDLASILTPSGSHAALGIALAPHVATLVVEKPMALRLEDADRLVETCECHGTRLFVVKQNRYNPAIRMLRQAVDQGRFGRMVLGTVRIRWTRTQEYYDQDAWRGTWKEDGGVFTNQASHYIDLLQWLMGPVAAVKAYVATRLVRIETEDTGVAVLRFKSGALGVLEATTATRPRDLEGSLSILGEEGSVVVGGFSANRVLTWNFSRPEPGDAEALATGTEPPDVYGFGHGLFYQDVLDCIETGRKPMLAGLEGRKSLEIINALYESAFTGRDVHLHYVPEGVPLGR
jgi:predicted dehydrogenase